MVLHKIYHQSSNSKLFGDIDRITLRWQAIFFPQYIIAFESNNFFTFNLSSLSNRKKIASVTYHRHLIELLKLALCTFHLSYEKYFLLLSLSSHRD